MRRGGADLILSFATQMSCDGYQASSCESRGAPVSKGPPLALQPSSLAASVSWHQKAFEHRLLVLNESSSFQIFRFNRWIQRGIKVFCKTCNSSVNFTLSRSDGRSEDVFLGVNKDGQLQKGFTLTCTNTATRHTMIFI